jgi:hypothetical protein
MNLSGVIVVVIVTLWGSLLIPALVRRHDSVPEVRSVDRFSYALRILSRRTPYVPGRREVLVPARSKEARSPLVSPAPGFVADLPAASPSRPQLARAEARRAALAAKRRRTLLALSAAFVLCLSLAVWSGGRWWLTLGISTVLLVMYVTHLRTEAQQLAAIERRRAQARRRARPAPQARQARTAARPAPRRAESAAGWEREHEQQVAVPDDGSWEPVRVTLPTYVTKPVVSRPTVAPPTGSWSDGLAMEQRAARYASARGEVYDQMSDDGLLGLGDEDEVLLVIDGLDDILERRRAVND